jgi:hypothetical protein
MINNLDQRHSQDFIKGDAHTHKYFQIFLGITELTAKQLFVGPKNALIVLSAVPDNLSQIQKTINSTSSSIFCKICKNKYLARIKLT